MMTDSELFGDVADPDLYQLNGFRVAELPVDATARDLSKRLEVVEMAGRAGMSIPPGPLPLFPIKSGKDPESVRKAICRLRDPEQRLWDEIFWFWPRTLGGTRGDEALARLAQGDTERATNVWLREQAHSESHVSTHNLAIFYHLCALELELTALSRPLTDKEKEQLKTVWEDAFRYWKLLLKHEGFWSRVTARIRDLRDPRLTPGTARKIRQKLPLKILSINAGLAIKAAERGDSTEANRHIAILRQWEDEAGKSSMRCESGFLPPLADLALRRKLEPLRHRIKHQCKAMEAAADADPEHADQQAKNLLEHAKPLLAIADRLLPVGHPMLEAIHDEVALAALGCVIPYGNSTEDWDTTLKLLEDILPLAVSETARNRIEQSLETVRRNRQDDLCWFCEKAKADEEETVEVKMYGDVTRTPTLLGVQVTWRQATIKVPRCAACRAAHEKRAQIGFGIFLLVALAVGTGIGTFKYCGDGDAPNALLCVGVCAVSICGIAILSKLAPRGVKPKSSISEYPPIKEKLGKGWAFGERPNVE